MFFIKSGKVNDCTSTMWPSRHTQRSPRLRSYDLEMRSGHQHDPFPSSRTWPSSCWYGNLGVARGSDVRPCNTTNFRVSIGERTDRTTFPFHSWLWQVAWLAPHKQRSNTLPRAITLFHHQPEASRFGEASWFYGRCPCDPLGGCGSSRSSSVWSGKAANQAAPIASSVPCSTEKIWRLWTHLHPCLAQTCRGTLNGCEIQNKVTSHKSKNNGRKARQRYNSCGFSMVRHEEFAPMSGWLARHKQSSEVSSSICLGCCILPELSWGARLWLIFED